ncbi:MAG: serine hydrolase [Spirochaetes bacterium]|jgi:CubicO group peptidase (beta-lactamase class C family)|nr:serine hydrolase [Spirochaetota bacterium]
MDAVTRVVTSHLGGTFPGAAVAVLKGNEVRFRRVFGLRQRAPREEPLSETTVFDVASLTKPLATTLVAFRLVDEGTIELNQPIGMILPELRHDLKELTFRQLLTHTAGLPAVPLLHHLFPDAQSVTRHEARRHLLQIGPERVPGTEVEYSCSGFQILGEVLSAAGGARLDELFRRLVAGPLELQATGFCPPREARANCATTERCPWRGRWLRGEVHDESAYCMGGVAGNAGLFSTLDEIVRLADVFRGKGVGRLHRGAGQVRLVSRELMDAATRSYTDGMAQRRGLGVQLNSEDAAGGPALSTSSYGHTGFTGTSFWIDPDQDLLVVALSNRVHFGRDTSAEAIKQFRHELHAAALSL